MAPGFYDPLYEYIPFEGLLPSRTWRPGERGFSLSDVIKTPEFTRQAFLRQNGMGFLVFPSSTHTRLAHALGSCHLGRLAAGRVRIRRAGAIETVGLGEFLEETNWGHEFSLALLLHDLGHFPFSHTIEHSGPVWDWFGSPYNHEMATRELILGKGDFYEAFPARSWAPPGSPRLSEILPALCPRGQQAVDAICCLIDDDEAALASFSPEEVAQLRLLHVLVSGLLDLDRMDHYRRDLYFSGARAGTVINYESLMNGITITYNPDGEPAEPRNIDSNACVSLSGDAWGQAASLLDIKRRLQEEVFHNGEVLAYEAMLGEALHAHLMGPTEGKGGRPRRLFDLLTLTDDQFLDALAVKGDERVRTLIGRIRGQQPYRLLCRISLSRGGDAGLDMATIEKFIRESCKQTFGEVLTYGSDHGPSTAPGDDGTPEARPSVRIDKEWLNLENLELEEDPSVIQGGKDPRRKGLDPYRSRPDPSIWVFSEGDHRLEEVRDPIVQLRREIRRRFAVTAELVRIPV